MTYKSTGASSGIGQGCAVEFARQGSNLILTARRIERLVALRDRLANDYRVKVHVAQVDVQDRAQVINLLGYIPYRHDILYNHSIHTVFYPLGQQGHS